MQKNKLFFLFVIFLSVIFFNFVSVDKVFADGSNIISFTLNGVAGSATFNPNNNESVSIEIRTNVAEKFSRIYICSTSQSCDGSAGDYTRYFSPNSTSSDVIESWNGRTSSKSDAPVAADGEYKVMASMTDPTSGLQITQFGSYSIFINTTASNDNNSDSSSTTSDNSNEDNNTSTSESSDTSTSTASTTVITQIVYISSHSDPEDISNYNDENDFEISAGRERLASVGSPIEFDAKYNIEQNGQCSPLFTWSFGDGFYTEGTDVSHNYKYPGEYQVVLNGTCGEYNSISRTTVNVVSPDILISDTENGDIEIKNNGATEINVGDWKIKGMQKDFLFPKDTIISAGNEIILAKNDLGIDASTSGIFLNNPLDGEVASDNFSQQDATTSQPESNLAVASSSDDISVADAEKLLKNYKDSLALKNDTNNKVTVAREESATSTANSNAENLDQTASVLNSGLSVPGNNSYSSSTKSFWSKLVDIPASGIKSFIHIFYNF
jgi:hypothetical protein